MLNTPIKTTPLEAIRPMATALARFSVMEYGKLNDRERTRIISALQEWLSPVTLPLPPKYFIHTAFRDSKNWQETLSNLPANALPHCKAAALNIARGSGRRPITEAMHQRINVLFAGAPCDDIEYTYQQHLEQLEAIEASLPPIFMRNPSFRISFKTEDGITHTQDISIVPWSESQYGFRAYVFESKTEKNLSYKKITGAVDLRTGEMLSHSELYKSVYPGHAIPVVITAHDARFVCWLLVACVRQVKGRVSASAKTAIHLAVNEALKPISVDGKDFSRLMAMTTAELGVQESIHEELTLSQLTICRRYSAEILGTSTQASAAIDEWFPYKSAY